MKVIIISDFWTGMRPIVLDGSNKPSGMPAFYNTLLAMESDERISQVECHFVGVGSNSIATYENKSFRKVKFIVYNYNSKIFLLKRLFGIVFEQSRNLNKESNKNMVLFGHGAIGSICGIISKLTGIKNTRRVYGTFLVDLIHFSKFRMFLKYPLAYSLFSLPHEKLIVTNDGTHGDMVYKKINGNQNKLHFLVNGVNKKEHHYNPRKIISYVARIDRWKQQDVAIRAFYESKYAKENYTLKIAGPIYDKDYYQELVLLVSKLNLNGKVEILGPLSKEDADNLLVQSALTLSFYDTSNFGNVFIEALQIGVPILSLNINGSLDYVDRSAYIQLENYDITHISQRMDSVLQDDKYLEEKSFLAISFSKKAFTSWDERASSEVNILLDL